MPLRRSKQAIGNCHLCGTVGPLTFEHIPPKAAFNDCRVLEADIYRLIGSNLIDELNGPKGKYNQKGAGGYTLCSSCNSNTGSWYGHSYIEFIKQGYSYLYNFKQDDRISVTFQIKSLKVLKQIFIMFCSACPPDFAVKHPDLVRYLLNRESRDFDGSIKILISFYDLKNSHSLRQSGLQPV